MGLASTPASVPWDGACDADAELRAAAELPLCGLRARRPPPDHAQPSPLSCAGGAVPAAPHGRRARRRSEQTWKASLNCKLASFIQHTLVVPSAVPKSHPAVQNRSKTSSVTRYDTMGAGGVSGVPGRGPRRARAVPGLAGIGGACARRARRPRGAERLPELAWGSGPWPAQVLPSLGLTVRQRRPVWFPGAMPPRAAPALALLGPVRGLRPAALRKVCFLESVCQTCGMGPAGIQGAVVAADIPQMTLFALAFS